MMLELTHYVSGYLGNYSTTFESELRECGRELLGELFGGVFAKGGQEGSWPEVMYQQYKILTERSYT